MSLKLQYEQDPVGCNSDETQPAANDSQPPTTQRLEEWLANPTGSHVTLTTGDDPEVLASSLLSITHIAIEFPDITDGRGFSLGRRLRDMGYTGPLRATGNYATDQLQYLHRCGYDCFDLPAGVTIDLATKLLGSISVAMQASTISERQVAFNLR
jgi:phosphoadenosine phosphosulfate reductase